MSDRRDIFDRLTREAEERAVEVYATFDRYDIAYNLKREAEERAAAAAADNPAARESHCTMADRYADRAWGRRERRCEDGNAC